MTDFKITVGVKEIKLKAETESEASTKALEQLASNIAWVTVVKVEPRTTGFHYEAPEGE